MKTLVTGGAGYIGSHAVRALLKSGHQVVVLDDLSHGTRAAVSGASTGSEMRVPVIEGSVSDRPLVLDVLERHHVEAVMHFAAFIEVGESVSDPAKYYRNNFSGALSLMESMKEAHVNRLVFSSTAAVYGNPVSTPITEEQALAPINPYGRTKMMVELAIDDFSRAYGLGYVILRYFNVAGADPDGLTGECHSPESHLIPRVLDTAIGRTESISIFGTDYATPDGTCIRDYIHVEDLAEAHVLALNAIKNRRGDTYNLGSEKGFSVREVIESCERITKKKIPVVEKPRRPGDPAVLIASSEKIRKSLGWKRRYPELDTIVGHAWNWHQGRKAKC